MQCNRESPPCNREFPLCNREFPQCNRESPPMTPEHDPDFEDLRIPINPLPCIGSNVLKVRRVDVLQRDVDLDAFPLAEFQKLRFP